MHSLNQICKLNDPKQLMILSNFILSSTGGFVCLFVFNSMTISFCQAKAFHRLHSTSKTW